MDNSKTYAIAALAGIGSVVVIWLLFPPPPNFLYRSYGSTNSNEEPLTSILSIRKTRGVSPESITPELLNKNRVLGYAIRQVEIQYFSELWCLSQPIPPNDLRSCEQATFTANITHSSADSIVRDILTASGNPPFDYLTGSTYDFEFAVEERGTYSITVSVLR
jgi:hypothetical protein